MALLRLQGHRTDAVDGSVLYVLQGATPDILFKLAALRRPHITQSLPVKERPGSGRYQWVARVTLSRMESTKLTAVVRSVGVTCGQKGFSQDAAKTQLSIAEKMALGAMVLLRRLLSFARQVAGAL